MDHLPFWHFPPISAGVGFGSGTGDIIEYMASLRPSQYAKPYGWMVRAQRHPVAVLSMLQDPDFLETLFWPTMSFIDSRTEFTFWSMWSAPLLVATDLRNLGIAWWCARVVVGVSDS
jgi:hypothetical protein